MSRTPPWFVYTTHLTAISHSLSTTPPDLKATFGTIQTLLSAAEAYKDPAVSILTHILRLRILVDAAMWDSVEDSLALAESILGLSYNDDPTPTSKEAKMKAKDDFITFENPFEASMAVHTLLLGVMFYTHVGKARIASPRLSHLHALLDYDVLKLFRNGTIEVSRVVPCPFQVLKSFIRSLYLPGRLSFLNVHTLAYFTNWHILSVALPSETP
jgi:hypothetical protein